jgi:glycosyltransferase involved in cell wall biosynthesis
VISAVGIVVPAHNEEDLLPACLRALRRAGDRLSGVPVRVVVVADSCTDGSAEVARSLGADVVSVAARNVGTARAAGMREVLGRLPGVDPGAVWLATTDADTVVPADWLRRQVGFAEQAWDAVLGTVAVTDWAGQPAQLPAAFAAHYEYGPGPHPHVHGANLGVRGSAYLAAGGFQDLATAEDHALLAALTKAGCPALRATNITVQTSGRPTARAPRGFSHLLATIAASALSPEPAAS